jgi:catechol 2,3-dioxygenase-like lactoylglutathione lyase family enzyme
MSVRVQPLLTVADVEAASAWYQRLLGLASGHGGPEYERLVDGDRLVLQLHARDVDHHHGPIAPGDAAGEPGRGVAVWFEVDDLDDAAARARRLGARVESDVHPNPNAGHRELWLRDLDGYLVVLASHAGDVPFGAAASSP